MATDSSLDAAAPHSIGFMASEQRGGRRIVGAYY